MDLGEELGHLAACAGRTQRMPEVQLYPVRAQNSARESENRIHDDTVARRFGFAGGLVPGVEVYAYMAHAPVARWGREWLEHGAAECRFVRPVYDGDDVVIRSEGDAEGITLAVVKGSDVCASGRAYLSTDSVSASDFPDPPSPPAERPPADETTLEPGTLLGMRPLQVTPELAEQHRRDVRESDEIYLREQLVHPGMVLRTCNWALSHNVVLGPWMHVGSAVRNLSAARIGEFLSVRARVTGNYERKGHRFVEFAALVIADERSVARIDHVAIYRPRQVAEAA